MSDRESKLVIAEEHHADGLQIYTDASFDPVKNVCGWAFVVTSGSTEVASNWGQDGIKSNNAAEALALLQALKWLNSQSGGKVIIWSDSSYVVEACHRWLRIWKTNRWRRIDPNPSAKKRRIADRDVWRDIDIELSKNQLIEVVWCKGHAGNLHNERADTLATMARLTAFSSQSTRGCALPHPADGVESSQRPKTV